MYVVDCWGGAHPTLEKHIVRLTLHMMVSYGKKCDKIFFFSSCGLSFVKFVKQISLLNRTRYSAHFDTKLRSILKNSTKLTINITMLTIAAQMFIAAWKQNAAEDLLAKKTTIVGTLRRNKTEVPSELTEAMGREVGSSLFCFDRQLTLVSYILKRKKCVLLLSTMHHDDA
ncbi:hypothetical protein T05_13239, partial [Trichinella murrelli]